CLESSAGNIRQYVLPMKNRFAVRVYAQALIPLLTRGYDLLHFSKNLGLFGPIPPSVVTVYDLTTLIHPELFPKLDVWYWKTVQKATVQKASRVIAISEATARDLKQYYQLTNQQIRVIYPSIDPRFRPATPAEINRVREKYHLPDSYILHVGRIDVKKKLTLLVEAFARLSQLSCDNNSSHLVMVGEVYAKGQDNELLPLVEKLGLTKRVIFTGKVPDEDLPPIITGARVTVSASVHEGFGLSAVESLACGTPLIAYRAGALQEAVGEAAFLIDNLNPESLASALRQVMTQPELRAELSEKGIARAQRYQSQQNVQQTLKLYEEIVNENK
ncbi:MAG TPA: glycosyltransferase family 1 protein, partial [Anaerolineales bacterium]